MDIDRTRLVAVFALSASVFLASSHAIAGCEDEIGNLAPTLTSGEVGELAQEVMEEALALFDEASSLCNGGDEEGSLQKITDAKALLGIQD